MKWFYDTDCIENIFEKGEIAHFERFHRFLQCFIKAIFFIVLKWVYMKERVNMLYGSCQKTPPHLVSNTLP